MGRRYCRPFEVCCFSYLPIGTAGLNNPFNARHVEGRSSAQRLFGQSSRSRNMGESLRLVLKSVFVRDPRYFSKTCTFLIQL